MSVHMIWGLVGFNLALLFMWVYFMLRTRGFRFFWAHPLLAGGILLITLYALESFFSDLSEAEVSLDWGLTVWVGIPLCILGLVFFYRAIQMHKKI